MIVARLYMALGALALIGALMGFAYVKGRTDGRVQQLQSAVKAYEKREKIDGSVEDLSRFDLCLQLGGVPAECAQLRGLAKAAPGE